VVTAVDGDECLRKVEESNPDLVLLDIMMPGTPISEIIGQIKEIKIAFMSIVRKSDMERRGLYQQENIVHFFQKPFNVDDMVDTIEEILGE
ncbi:MAG: response regulator, partial [Candidatus Thermoplasmatota archaeon]